ncbi:unnamed protein product [Moneuplotes crassus]|uniref:Uncharacterized protein n=1 Tax=Euplotes crassus TaxID=5936 RepID=A0AAD1XEM5_EUPCR|nr:unnamed protein product [Moneuplotes crassus]
MLPILHKEISEALKTENYLSLHSESCCIWQFLLCKYSNFFIILKFHLVSLLCLDEVTGLVWKALISFLLHFKAQKFRRGKNCKYVSKLKIYTVYSHFNYHINQASFYE